MKNEYYLVKYTPYWATTDASGPDYPHGPNYRQDWEQLQVRGFVKCLHKQRKEQSLASVLPLGKYHRPEIFGANSIIKDSEEFRKKNLTNAQMRVSLRE